MHIINKSKRSCLTISLISFMVFYFMYSFKNTTPTKTPANQMKKYVPHPMTLISKCQKCLAIALEGISEDEFDLKWHDLGNIVTDCCEKSFEPFQAEPMRNKDEAKYIIHPINSTSPECHVITLGIGNDTLVEENMRKKNPLCTFLGVDPDFENGGFEYMQLGKFVQTAVGVSNGTYVASVLSNNSYINRTLRHVSFKHILHKFFPYKVVDYLLMDIEGPEFEIFQDLVENYPQYPTICTLNVEYHTPDNNKKRNIFNVLYKSVIQKLYLPLLNWNAGDFNRAYLFNINDNLCLKKYLNISF